MSMHDFYYMRISPDKLKVGNYQRPVSQSKIKKIVDNFDMDLFNNPKVSHRKDGYYYIFDGQHSMVAHKKIFGEHEPINCKVYEGLTYEEEVNLFVQQNGVCSVVNTNDKLKALYNGHDIDVVGMVNAAKTVGIKIDFVKGNSQNHISATNAAYFAWKLLGKDDFINILSVIKQTWGGEPSSFQGGFIKGLAIIYKKYGAKIRNETMIFALKRHTVDYYIREAADMKGSSGNRYAKCFINTYNYRKITNRLEEEKGA